MLSRSLQLGMQFFARDALNATRCNSVHLQRSGPILDEWPGNDFRQAGKEASRRDQMAGVPLFPFHTRANSMAFGRHGRQGPHRSVRMSQAECLASLGASPSRASRTKDSAIGVLHDHGSFVLASRCCKPTKKTATFKDPHAGPAQDHAKHAKHATRL